MVGVMVASSLRSAAAAALLVVAAPAAAADPALPPAAREAAAAVDAFHAALRRGDTKAASDLLTDEALVFEEGRAERSKSEYQARHLGADAAFSRAVRTETVRRRGDSAGHFAWIASENRARGSFRGAAVDRVVDETMVLRRIGGRWKIVHIHWSSAAASVE